MELCDIVLVSMYAAWIRLKPFSFGSQPLGGNVPHTRGEPNLEGFLHLDRTGRVRNEPMFGVAAKETECAILTGRRSRLATGTCVNKAERLMYG